MPALVFALIMAYFVMKAIESGREQARTEVRRVREEVTRNVREARETVGRAGRSPAGRTALGAARTAVRAAAGVRRGMRGARRGAGPRARRILAGTGPLRRVFRAAWQGGLLGAREALTRRTAQSGTRRRGRRMPEFWLCGECHRPTSPAALHKSPNGPWYVCGECLADNQRQTPGDVPDPAAGAWDAEIVPDPEPQPENPPSEADAGPSTPSGEITADTGTAGDTGIPDTQPDGALPAADADPGQLPEAGPGTETSLTPAAAQAAVPLAGHPAITTGEHMAGTEIALPAGIGGTVNVTGGAPGGSGGGDSRTHGLWLTAVARQAAFAEAGKQHLNAMAARLHAVEGGRTQIRDIYNWHRAADAFIDELGDMVAEIDPGEQRFIAAIPGGDLDEMCVPGYYATGGRR